MKRFSIPAIVLLLAFLASPALAADPGPGPEMMGMGQGMGQGMGPQMHGMMNNEPPCRQMNDAMPNMGMGRGMGMGMMHQHMAHSMYLDRAEALDLSAKQVAKLKAIRSECEKDNIRTAAEARIVRLELSDLLEGDDWSLDAVEPLIRKMEKLEGDMHLRHVRALADARKVLSAEQLKKARSLQARGLDELFE